MCCYLCVVEKVGGEMWEASEERGIVQRVCVQSDRKEISKPLRFPRQQSERMQQCEVVLFILRIPAIS